MSTAATALRKEARFANTLLNAPRLVAHSSTPPEPAASSTLDFLRPALDGRRLTVDMAPKSRTTAEGPLDVAADMEDQAAPRGAKDERDEPKPAWSELKTKAGKERKRLPLACIACRRKKIRCSGEKPACKHCLRSRTPCVYKVTTRKAAPRTDYMTMLDKRLKRMEERVIKIIPDPEPAKMASIGRASVKPPAVPTLKAPSAKKRAAEEAFGADVETWADGDAKTDNLRRPNVSEQAENQLLTDGMERLPPKDIQEHLAEIFFDNCYGQAYYLLHKPSFMRRLKAGTIPPVLILAVCAIAARFSTHPKIASDPPFLRGEPWAKPAREIAIKRYDEPNITILIVLVILGLHEFGTCQGGRSWMLGGMAIRMAASLQLHRELDHDPLGGKGEKTELNITDREIRRRAMWSCFMMDRFISSGTDRPMMLDEETIEVQLPIEESRFQMELPGVTEHLDGSVSGKLEDNTTAQDNMGVAAYLIRTIGLWGRVIRYFNLGGRRKDPHPLWHADSKFSELKKQVDELQQSLPERLKFSPDNLRTHAAQSLGNQFLFLHICYQLIILFLHKFAIPTRPNVAPAREMPNDFVRASGRAAIEAAGQISELLSEGSPHCLMAPFAGYCAFLSSTVHVWGIFSKNPTLEAASKRNLATNVKYLSQMKQIWGVLYLMSENLRTVYRRFADATSHDSKLETDASENEVLNYGSWFNQYPHGVAQSDYQEPVAEGKHTGDDAALSQKSDLQTVEAFFKTPTPPAASSKRKSRKSASGGAAGSKKENTASPSEKTAVIASPAAVSSRKLQRPPPKQSQQAIPRTSGSFPPNLKTDAGWAVNLQAQGAYANMPQSAYAIPGHTQRPLHQQFRRPSQPHPTTPTHSHTHLQLSPHHSVQEQSRRQRASFDAAHITSHMQLNTNLDSFPASGSAMGMFAGSPPFASPSPQSHHPHSATLGGFPNAPFFNTAGPAVAGAATMGGIIGDMDRQMVFSAYNTDPGVQTNLWAPDLAGDFGLDLGGGGGGGGSEADLTGGPGDIHAQAAAAAAAAAATGQPSSSASNTGSVNEGSAWFLPFNLDVTHDAFGGEFGMGDGLEGDGEAQ